jgi:hypothetical protein
MGSLAMDVASSSRPHVVNLLRCCQLATTSIVVVARRSAATVTMWAQQMVVGID